MMGVAMANRMKLLGLWWNGLVSPGRAFEELRNRPAPAWGFRVVLLFNLAISATTVLAQHLLGRGPLMPSALTFLADERYLLAEIFFLPPLRILVWIAGAGIIHLGLRLAGEPGGFDTLLNIDGLINLVSAPFVLLPDWLLVALNRYELAQFTHSLFLPWSLVLNVIGMRRLLGTRTLLAVLLTLLSFVLTVPLLALLAR